MSTLHDLRVSLRDSVAKIDKLEKEISALKSELSKRNQALKELDVSSKKKDEIISMKDSIIKEKDNHIQRLEAEITSLTSPSSPSATVSTAKFGNGILTDATNFMSNDNIIYNGVIGASSSQSSPLHYNKTKRIAISAEPAQQKFNKTKELRTNLKKYPKSDQTKEFLTNAIFENDFMKNLESDQIENIVECMYPVEFAKNSLIIKEGDIGNMVYITQEGTVEVSKNGKVLCAIGSGRVFGELAILYNCTRTASIKALTNCKLWAIDRNMFQIIMMRSGIEKHDEYMELLKNIPNFKSLRDDILTKLIDLIDEVTYANKEFIVRQYAKGDTLFIISKGRVAVTKSPCKWDQAKFVKHLTKGDYFGENALYGEETRQFNVVTDDPNGVTCLVLDRQTYNQLLNDTTTETAVKRTGSTKLYKRAQTASHVLAEIGFDEEEEEELGLAGIRLAEFEIIGTLGVGGFGRVELVRNTRDQRTYALKVLKKQHIVETKQQDHVLNERNIMMEIRSFFICRLFKTFKDKKYLYLLLEACLGGELWTLLREKGSFEEQQTKFYTACVIEALGYLHSKGIVFRDLKPENLILSANGYCKLVDFGFAKKIGLGKKTWTFCGTPEYVAPEIILNKGHDLGADFWSLGVLIFELLTGNPPFVGNDPMSTYNIILKGIEAIDFPRKIPKIPAVLIKRLCRENAVDRLGYQRGGIKDVSKHKWFEGFSWESLRNQTLEAPTRPIINDNSDLSNFDKYPDDNDPEPMDDLTGWDFAF